MLFIKALILIALFAIFLQDIRDREVYWILFPFVALLAGTIFFYNTTFDHFLISITLNLLLITSILCVIFLYIKLKMRTSIDQSLGLGDVLSLYALCFTFSTVSFIIIFVIGLFLSLLMHLILQKSSKYETVPLAGNLSLIFGLSYLAYFANLTPYNFSI
ncbi:hypothetical protein BST86_01665 [Nonlabens agnitus]|uniref:Prepilin type IV endopeptidase peptidase domain-containing protein n=1 Tax=Nonlabens agnitus TaxID=870484 RepID=A0A2S9WRH4_9FLAO|nr:hypothetical protein BST86_01665 [Nonlabens agnitus]